jgi:hypothetical protein
MNSEQFANFFKSQGARIVETDSGYWYEIHPFCFQNIPYHQAISPGDAELTKLFYRNGAMLLRFNSSDENNYNSGHIWICDARDYNLANLETKSRNQTRRGLENNIVKKIDFDIIMERGYRLIKETTKRQLRDCDYSSLNRWLSYCNAAKRIGHFEAWGAFFQDRLISFLVGATIDNYYYVMQQASETEHLKTYPNNALIYRVVQAKLAETSINIVSYGLDSVEDTPGLRKFKQGMGFKLAKYNQKILINPFFGWLKSRKFKQLLDFFLKMSPKNNYLRKAEAVLSLISS